MTSRWQCFKAAHRRSKGTCKVTSQSWRGGGVGTLPQPPHTCKGKKKAQREVSLSRAQGPTVAESGPDPGLAFFAECPHSTPIYQTPCRVQGLLGALSLEPYCAACLCFPLTQSLLSSLFWMGAHPPGPVDQKGVDQGPRKTESSPCCSPDC